MSRLSKAHKSRTVLFNAVVALLVPVLAFLDANLPALQGQLSAEIYQGLALFAAVGNAGLRFATTQDLADK